MAQILLRIETKDGMKGFAMDGDAAAENAAISFIDVMDFCPGPIKVIIEGALFALRHGPIQKMLREKGMPEMCKNCPDKNAEAVRAMARIMFRSVTDEQMKDVVPGESIKPVDLNHKDFVETFSQVFIRREDLDGPAPQVEGQNEKPVPALGEATGAVVDSYSEITA